MAMALFLYIGKEVMISLIIVKLGLFGDWRIVALKKYLVLLPILCITVLGAGCGKAQNTVENTEVDQEAIAEETLAIAEAEPEDLTEETDSSADSSTEEVVVPEEDQEEYNADEFTYDTSFLVQEDGVSFYRLSDPELIKKYDVLYAEAFADVIASFNEVKEWMDQDYENDQPKTTTNLLYKETTVNTVINTGSNFEMDIDFDLNNMGYTYVDLDSDGVFEMILGVASYKYNDGLPMDVYERAYALADGKPVKILEGGARINQWLGSDGHIYEYGSGGAAYGGTWKIHFDKSRIPAGGTEWGAEGFVQDEFIGYWNGPVHIMGPIEDMDAAALLPENQVSDEDWGLMEEEWEKRRVQIDWLKMSDYLALYYPEGV